MKRSNFSRTSGQSSFNTGIVTLLIGLGTGVSAGELALWPEWKKIVVAELLPNVVGGSPLFF